MNEYWAVLSQVGLWGWIASVLCMVYLCFPSYNIFLTRNAVKYGLGVLLFFVLWIAGMMLA
jgi:hypothetical protein